MRDKRGLARESIQTTARTLGDLYAELSERHGLSLPHASIKAVVDEDFASMDTDLRDGSTVAFLPPVAGG